MEQSQWQPAFKLEIGGQDVTHLVHEEITLSQEEGFITKLEFRLKKGIYFCSVMNFRGASVSFWGGYLDVEGQYKKMFTGATTFVYLDLEESGLAFARCECYSSGYANKTGLNTPHSYPMRTSKREWAKNSPLKVSDIVRGLIKEMGAKVGQISGKEAIILPDKMDKEFTYKSQLHQRLNDWGILNELAKSCGCSLYEEYSDKGEWLIFFVDRNVQVTTSKGIEFVFLGRDTEQFFWNEEFVGGKGLKIASYQEEFGVRELKDGQIQLKHCTVQEDFKVPLFRVQPKLDTSGTGGGASEDLYATYDFSTGKWSYYVLEWDKVVAAAESQKNASFTEFDPGGFIDKMDFETLKNTIFRKVEFKQGNALSNKFLQMTDLPYPIRRASGSCRGNVNIKAYSHYSIYGISKRYSTLGSKMKWYMISCKHEWGGQGYMCHFDFYQQ